MKREKHKKKARKPDRIGTIVLVLVLLIGLGILIYPSFSDWWNNRNAKKIISDYEALVAEIDTEDYSVIFDAAYTYNEALAEVGSASALADPDQLDNYEDTLDIIGIGVMGYITIEKINVELPIYHGTSEGVLEVAVGHLEGSSLPVGGESTHCVLSAHRGLPSAMLFTDLDKMEVGDTFTITVLDQVLTYQVDQITIVEPEEAEDLYIEEGKDYCTLMTCTPYAVNTHRLLVRGVRIETEETSLIHVTAEAYKINTVIVAFVVAVPILVILLIGLLVSKPVKHRKQNGKDFMQDQDLQK